MAERARELAADIVTSLGTVTALMKTRSQKLRVVRGEQLKSASDKAAKLKKALADAELGSLEAALGKVDLPKDLKKLETDIDKDIAAWKKVVAGLAKAGKVDRKKVDKALDDFKKELKKEKSAAIKRGFALATSLIKAFVPLV